MKTDADEYQHLGGRCTQYGPLTVLAKRDRCKRQYAVTLPETRQGTPESRSLAIVLLELLPLLHLCIGQLALRGQGTWRRFRRRGSLIADNDNARQWIDEIRVGPRRPRPVGRVRNWIRGNEFRTGIQR